MKALVIAPQPFFTARGTPYSVYYRTRTMAELGEEIDLLTYGRGKDVELGNVRLIRIPQLKILGPVKIGPSFQKLVLDVLVFFYALGLLIRHRYDYVHAHEEAVFIARFFKPIFRFKLLYDMHSSLPQQLTNFSYTRSRLLIGAFEFLERSALSASDAVIVVCPALLEQATAVVGGAEKIVLIENSLFDKVEVIGVEASEASNAAIAAARELAAKGHPLVVYTGTLEPYQGIDLLLEGFARLAVENASVHLLVVGGEPGQVETFQEMAGMLGIAQRCLFAGTVAQETAVSCNRLATMVVSPRRTGTNTPLKIYAQLASGTPLVATRIESHTQVLSDEVAMLVTPEPRTLAQGMKAILDDPQMAQRLTDNAARLYDQQYSRQVYVEKTRRVLELLGSGS